MPCERGDEDALDVVAAQPDEAQDAGGVLVHVHLRLGERGLDGLVVPAPVFGGDERVCLQIGREPYRGHSFQVACFHAANH